MDYYLPDLGGSALLKRLKQLRPGIRVLVLSASEDPDDRERVMAAGAQGFLHKSADCRARCWTRWSRSASRRADPRRWRAAQAARADAGAGGRHGPAQRLDAAPGAVLRLMCDGLRNREISERLSMTETVKTHVTAILATLGVVNRTQATLVARRADCWASPLNQSPHSTASDNPPRIRPE